MHSDASEAQASVSGILVATNWCPRLVPTIQTMLNAPKQSSKPI